MIEHKIIATDFDGTLCEHMPDGIGEPNTRLIEYLKYEQTKGTKVILWTCRADKRLKEAVKWCKERGLKFDEVNDNVKEALDYLGENTRKIFAHQYIDDKADNMGLKLPYQPPRRRGAKR